MRNTLAIFQREFVAYFFSPIAYIVSFVFIVVNNFGFYSVVLYLNTPQAPPWRPMEIFLAGNTFLWIYLPVVAPVLTMRLLAEEKRLGTIEMLMTAPVTEAQVVLGKYLASLAFYIVLWIPTLAYMAVLAKYGTPDYGEFLSGYIGIILLGAVFLSVGLLASSLTRNQIGAAILGMLPIFVIWWLPVLLPASISQGPHAETVSFFNVTEHLQLDFSNGIVDTRRIVLYLSEIVLMLFITVRIVETTKGR